MVFVQFDVSDHVSAIVSCFFKLKICLYNSERFTELALLIINFFMLHVANV